MKRISLAPLLKRGWMALVALLVVAITGFAIYRLHGIFGSHTNTSANSGLSNEIVPFNPKQVVLQVFGAPGAVATINYLDVNAQPQQVKDAPLPWSFTITSTEPAVVGNVVAQGNGDTIGCRIIVNGEVKDERTVNKADAYTFCLDKSG
ncbi:MAG: transport acessory protein MmpS [Mycobacterium sp.]|uniref:MmpS family transport accessory protein n=1 Tax=Mycobacterium sp. TaxID=1785 RepID=UPI001EBEAC7D|nr:MmpS family transport accessory protein [Mycobacterium sp.]MBW0019499.1 transport acessory protein MmpS [Mycobacterium sp.]